jgi:hypothetical protein
MLSMKTLNLKDFEGVCCPGMIGHDPSIGGQDTGVGRPAPVCQTVGSSFGTSAKKRCLNAKRIKHKNNFMHNLVKFKAAKIAHPILESLKQGDSGRTKVGLPKCLETQIYLDNF